MKSQLSTELKYSKRFKPSIVFDGFINDIPLGEFRAMYQAIEHYKEGSYFPDKTKRVQALPETEFIVYSIFIAILSNYRTRAIQDVACQIGQSLEVYDDLIQAVKTGAELLAICSFGLYDVVFEEEGINIVPKLKLDSNTEAQLEALCYMPPAHLKPKWTSNVGGWEWERKSIILGKNNHHLFKQDLESINKVQSIEWEIDKTVLANEVQTNESMDAKQFRTVVQDYLDEKFFFVWRYDKRGRMYSSGYDLNIQSNEYGKALISPVKREKLTGVGSKGLAMAIAGHAGKDKLTWSERWQWFHETEDKDMKWKEPILGRKALRAWYELESGTNYMMQLDATSSFAQLMACLTGCKATAKLCNLISTDKRENLYATVQNEMNRWLSDDEQVYDVKKPLMTHYYNSTAKPKEHFTETQLEIFYETINGLLPGCEDFMEAINQFWNPMTLDHTWTLPDGHVAHCKVTEMVDLRIGIDELNGRRFTFRYEKNQPSTNFRSLCPNVLHSVDAYVNREMIKRCDFDISSIHDCWLFHPNHFDEVRQTYREILAEIADSNLLEDILSELSGRQIKIKKLSNDLSGYILKSEYALS